MFCFYFLCDSVYAKTLLEDYYKAVKGPTGCPSARYLDHVKEGHH